MKRRSISLCAILVILLLTGGLSTGFTAARESEEAPHAGVSFCGYFIIFMLFFFLR